MILQPAYEPEGPLTVCPCCGISVDKKQLFACDDCFSKYCQYLPHTILGHDPLNSHVKEGRKLFAETGERLRVEGKLPLLPPDQDIQVAFTPRARLTVWDHLTNED